MMLSMLALAAAALTGTAGAGAPRVVDRYSVKWAVPSGTAHVIRKKTHNLS